MNEPIEQRQSVRVSARLEFEYRVEGSRQFGFLEDLSETGAYVDTPQPLPRGTEIDFTFQLPDSQRDEPISGRAVVVRTEPSVGMALHFLDLPEETGLRIRFYVAALFFEHDPSDLV